MSAPRHDVVVEIDAAGDASLDVEGLHGDLCLKALHEFERALGKIKRRREKPERFQTVGTRGSVRAKQGS